MIVELLLIALFFFLIQWAVEYVLTTRVRACSDCGTFTRKQGWLFDYPKPPGECRDCGNAFPQSD